jgi:Fe2+ transport system protein FeoA
VIVKVLFNKASSVVGAGEQTDDGALSTPASLADVKVRGAAIVAHVGGTRSVAIRLMEMGLLPGTRVEVLRIAPLGDPIEVKVRGFALSIRRQEARGIEVRHVEAPR